MNPNRKKALWKIVSMASACSLMGFCVATGQNDAGVKEKPIDSRPTSDELPKVGGTVSVDLTSIAPTATLVRR